MKKYNTMKNNVLILVSLILLIGCKKLEQEKVLSRVETLPFYDEATFTPKWFANDNDSLKYFHKIADFNLINQDGETISNKTFYNKIYITDFFFTTCPGICPKMTASMMDLQKEYINDDEVMLLSHSVTPEIDSVPTLKEYALKNEIVSSKWHLVTGNRKEIYDLGRKSYFVEEDLGKEKTANDFLHTENFVLVDKNKHIRGIYNGLNSNDIIQLITDVKTLKKEK
ncbi:SCO family protein [Flavobacterium sp. N2270]|uniref:SCO family protein n=1 Tax=Flavobacterium sp. N2270 TaxID=2986831 RepID=UPI002224E29E|nr:SCO family protein [Flavobacterium sp. N2270]